MNRWRASGIACSWCKNAKYSRGSCGQHHFWGGERLGLLRPFAPLTSLYLLRALCDQQDECKVVEAQGHVVETIQVGQEAKILDRVVGLGSWGLCMEPEGEWTSSHE